MKYFVIYCVALWPVFLALFVHFQRKRHDVEAVDLAAMIMISLIPFMRELIVATTILEEYKGVIFRKYK